MRYLKQQPYHGKEKRKLKHNTTRDIDKQNLFFKKRKNNA